MNRTMMFKAFFYLEWAFFSFYSKTFILLSFEIFLNVFDSKFWALIGKIHYFNLKLFKFSKCNALSDHFILNLKSISVLKIVSNYWNSARREHTEKLFIYRKNGEREVGLELKFSSWKLKESRTKYFFKLI